MAILLRKITPTVEEELETKRQKHLFVQWLISGNRRSLPPELKSYVRENREEARALYNHFRSRSRKQPKGKKRLFAR